MSEKQPAERSADRRLPKTVLGLNKQMIIELLIECFGNFA